MIWISGTVGIGLPSHTSGIGSLPAAELSGFSAPADFVQAFVAHAEMVSDLMEDGLADLLAETGGGEAHPKVRLAVDSDLVRHGTEVVIAPIGEHDPFIETQQIAVLSDLIRSRSFLDHDVQVVDSFHDPLG